MTTPTGVDDAPGEPTGPREPTAPGEPTADLARARTIGVLLTLSYDGQRFCGFTPQANGLRTVGGELLKGLQIIDPTITEVLCASRTDSGVHARDQRVAFNCKRGIPPRGWALGLSRHLPDDIAVRRAALVEPNYVPRYMSTRKRYRYRVLGDPLRDPFLAGRAWRIRDPLDDAALAVLAEEATPLLGKHDFAAFRSSADVRENTTRTLHVVSPERDPSDPRVVWITVEGDAFLHNMVRIIVGTLVDVARGRKPRGTVAHALAARDRRHGGITAPPDGLVLDRVWLRDEGDGAWPPDPDPA